MGKDGRFGCNIMKKKTIQHCRNIPKSNFKIVKKKGIYSYISYILLH
jgi:hypothetical protein